MLRYITRHGQTVDYRNIENDALYPPGDIPLSDLGREQARMLGERMKGLGFCGHIITSPYMRTLETAEIIAKITGSKILPCSFMREIIKSQSHADNFKGLTIEKIKEKYDCIDKDAELEYPWWYSPEGVLRTETIEDVRARIVCGLEWIDKQFPNEELLLVGHGASVGELLSVLRIPKKRGIRTMIFNCSLSSIDTADKTVPTMHSDTAHIKYELTTSNFKTREEFDKEYFDKPYEKEIELPKGIEEITGTKILHIGDTVSYDYPYYIKLIELVKPDIIIHTGDTADEVKVGRIPETRYEYITKIRILLEAMHRSGARLIIVPGNNDLKEEIAKIVPNAEIYEPNTVITIDGEECRLGHELLQMDFDKNWHFYGHGLRGEKWSYEKNTAEGPCRFNTMWGSFVVSISEKQFFLIKKQ